MRLVRGTELTPQEWSNWGLRAQLDRRIAEAHPGGKDTMPMDEGIKGELPDEKIR